MPELISAVEDHPEFEYLNTLVLSLITSITNSQADYYAINGRYFQGLEIPSVECDGLVEHEIDEKVKPQDQQEAWSDFDSSVFFNKATLPFKIMVDIYKTPHQGWGWVLTAKYIYEGDTWMYQHDEGPSGPYSGPFDEWYIASEGP